jgi:hypothetical protein
MADQKPQETQQNQGDPDHKPIPNSNEGGDIVKDGEKATSPGKASCQKEYKHPEIVINNQQGDNREGRRGNNINIIIAFVNLGLLTATFFIWKATRDSVKVARDTLYLTDSSIKSSDSTNRASLLASIKSSNAADSSYHETKKYDSLTGIRQDRQFKIDSIESRVRFEDERMSLQLQRNGIDSAQKQFELSNRPFVQVQYDSVVLEDFGFGKFTKLRCSYYNSGAFPARLLFHENIIYYSPYGLTDYVKKQNTGPDSLGDSLYIILGKGGYKFFYNVTYDTLNNYDYNALISGKKAIFVLGLIQYKNLMTGKKYMTKYCYRVSLAVSDNLIKIVGSALINQDDYPLD